MYSAVIALPWLAPELQHLESDPEGLTVFTNSVEQYFSARPRSSQDAANPFYVTDGDQAAVSLGDGGGASFLPQVCDAGNGTFAWLTARVSTAVLSMHVFHAFNLPKCQAFWCFQLWLLVIPRCGP